MAGRKLSNKDVDERLLQNNPTIIRVGNYIDIDTHINFKCLKCDRVWPSIPYHLMAGRGCAQCAGNKKLFPEDIDKKFIELNIPIIRIGEFVNSNKSFLCKCLICNNEWLAYYNYLIRVANDDSLEYFGCANCAGNKKLTNDIVDDRLLKLNCKIKRLEDVKGTDNCIMWRCEVCNYEWPARPDTITNDRSGCPKCHKSLGEKTVHLILDKHKIKCESNYKIYIKDSIRPKRIDFYLPNYNCFIEFNGIQHYKSMKFIDYNFGNHDFEKQKERDNNIKKYCKENKINLFEIDSRKYKNIMYKTDKFDFIDKLESDILEYLGNLNE